MISVLYVDDEPDLLELARLFLGQSGDFRIETSSSAQAVLDSFPARSCDAIVSDYQMPGMDGIAFLRAVREQQGEIPFILFTGRGREEVAIQALNSGADFYIQKGGEPQAQFAELSNKIRYAVARRQAEANLAASEERFRSVVNDQTEMIVRFAPDGTVTFANPACTAYISTLLGLVSPEGQNIRNLINHRDPAALDAFFAALTRDSPIQEIERDFVLQDGSRHWQRWSVRALFRNQESPCEFQAVGRDITTAKLAEEELRRKNYELNASYEQIAANEEELRQQLDELTEKQEALRNSEEKFRAFTENIPDLTTIVDQTGVYRYVSPSIQRITGWTADALLGKKFGNLDAIFGIEPEDRGILLETAREAIRHPGTTVPVPPFRLRDAGRKIRFIEGTHTYIPDVNGIQGIVFHGRDITDRVRAETELHTRYDELARSGRQLRESEEKFRGIFEHSHDALILFTENGCIDCNQRALELFGYPEKKVFLGLKPSDVSPPLQPDGQESGAAEAARIRAVFESGEDHFTWLHKRRDGTTFTADVLLSGFELEGKKVFLSSIREISGQNTDI